MSVQSTSCTTSRGPAPRPCPEEAPLSTIPSTPGHPVAHGLAPSLAVGPAQARPHLGGTRVAGLRGVRLLDGAVADVDLDDGLVVAVRSRAPADGDAHGPADGDAHGPADGDAHGPADGDAHGPADAAGVVLDARGWTWVPAPSEPHAHLDKALTAGRTPPGGGQDLPAAVAQWRDLAAAVDAPDVRTRALAALRRHLAYGVTSVRTHVDVLPPGEGGADPLRALDGLLALREEVAGALTLQVCLLAGWQVPDEVVAEAVARGVDVVGGCPHLAPDPRHETRRMLDVAERTGLPVDLHTDEQTAAPLLDVVDLAEQVLARGLAQRVTASHCVRLGSLPPGRLAPVLDLLARAGVGVVTLPTTNLFLQGRDATHLVPRGIAPVRALLDAGVTVAAGGDNLQDPFNRVGRGDPFETASLLVSAAHLSPREALDAVTVGARTVLGLLPAGAEVGCAADLLLVPDDDPAGRTTDRGAGVDLGALVAGPGDARVVLAGGRVVADTRVSSDVRLVPGPGAHATSTTTAGRVQPPVPTTA